MFRLILILSLLPIIIALVARWWFGLRVLASEGKLACRCNLSQWMPPPSDGAIMHRAEKSASEFGHELRLKALADWRSDDAKTAIAREGTRRFGKAVPPLSMMIAVFALLVGKVPLSGAMAIVAAAIAFTAVFGLLSLPTELQAIARAANNIRKQGSFPSRDDEDLIIRCAIAHAWIDSPPAIFRWLQR